MRNYEVTFIVDPVLSSDEIKATAQTYVDMLNSNGNKLIHADEMGLRQLAYPIKKRSSGIYYCLEFTSENGLVIAGLELALKRDERIMRFLSVSLDKHGVKYNEDKRSGKIGQSKKRFRPITTLEPVSATPQAAVAESSAPKAPAVEATAVEAPANEAPANEAPAKEAPAKEAPAVEAPAMETPAVEAPAMEAPAVEAPTMETPTVEAPVAEAPVGKDEPIATPADPVEAVKNEED